MKLFLSCDKTEDFQQILKRKYSLPRYKVSVTFYILVKVLNLDKDTVTF